RLGASRGRASEQFERAAAIRLRQAFARAVARRHKANLYVTSTAESMPPRLACASDRTFFVGSKNLIWSVRRGIRFPKLSVSTEQVRAALARGAGPPGVIPISTEQSVTIGFCQEWLSWHDHRKDSREGAHHRWQIFLTMVGIVVTVLGRLVLADARRLVVIKPELSPQQPPGATATAPARPP